MSSKGFLSKLIRDKLQEKSSDVPTPSSTNVFDVLTYAESPWGLKMNLYPVQKFIVKLYYGLPLEDKQKVITITDRFKTKVLYKLTEVEYLKFLYNEGRCNIPEQDGKDRRQLILPIGRRSGKSTMSAIFASYELYRLISLGDPHAYYGLPRGNQIKLLSVATGKDQAAILYNDITAHLAHCEFFKPYKVSTTSEAVQFMTPADQKLYGDEFTRDNGKFASFKGKASLKVAFAAAASNRIRGSGCIIIIMDEMAHFLETGTSSAKDIYDAVVPSALAFSPKDPVTREPIGPVESRIICISSPLNRSGKFYDLFQLAMSRAEGSGNMLVVQAPTWEVNPTVEPEFLKERFYEDPNVFETEFGAQFSDRRRGWIEREEDLIACVDPNHRPRTFGIPRNPYQVGLDLGLGTDGTALAITHVEDDKVVLDYHELLQAGTPWKESNPHLLAPVTEYAKTLESQDRLDFDSIADWIDALGRKFSFSAGLFDQWNGIPLQQALTKRGLRNFQMEFFSRDVSSKMYQAMKLFIFDKRLVLYDWPTEPTGVSMHSPLIKELLTLQQTQMSKYQIIVEAPQTAGFHDDMSDALVRSFWLSLERANAHKGLSRDSNETPGTRNPFKTMPSATAYQASRARRHGVFSDRLVPRYPRGRR